MWKGISFFAILLTISNAFGAANYIPKRFNTITSHDDVYPYRLNNTQQTTKKTSNTMNTTSVAPVGKRGIVKRTTNARAATTNINSNTSDRRVVPRTNTITTVRAANNTTLNSHTTDGRTKQNVVQRSAPIVRVRNTNSARTTSDYTSTEKVSAKRCFADYKECMEMYCQHEDTPYNRCYCSSKLSQIDSKYQNKIDELIQEIVRLQYSSDTTSEDIKEYWDKTVGVYTKTNPWVNIDNALNIEWPDAESRVRGQNAFNTGHEYCVKNLHACSYMSSNMRNAYKSEIARDCDTYEKSLQKIQMAAESVIQTYKD